MMTTFSAGSIEAFLAAKVQSLELIERLKKEIKSDLNEANESVKMILKDNLNDRKVWQSVENGEDIFPKDTSMVKCWLAI